MLVIVLLAVVVGQFDPYQPLRPKPSPQERRAARETAVARVGPEARSLVETYEEAVPALRRCSPQAGKKLAEFHNGGQLARLPRPRDFLVMLSTQQPSADAALLWAVMPEHAALLVDPDNFQAYLENPAEIFLQLTPLQQLAAEVRARRLNGQVQALPPGWRDLAIAGGVLGVAAWLLWRWRNRPRYVITQR